MPVGEDEVVNYAFQVEIDGVTTAQFKEVGGLSAEIEVVEHREEKVSGIPVLRKVPGAQKWGDLLLKRGKTNDRALWDWIKAVQDGNIDGARRNGSIVVFDSTGEEIGRFNFTKGWPSKVSVSSLQAGESAVLIEECTIVHEGLVPA